MKLIVVSGGFDPIHSGHIAYFKSANIEDLMTVRGINDKIAKLIKQNIK